MYLSCVSDSQKHCMLVQSHQWCILLQTCALQHRIRRFMCLSWCAHFSQLTCKITIFFGSAQRVCTWDLNWIWNNLIFPWGGPSLKTKSCHSRFRVTVFNLFFEAVKSVSDVLYNCVPAYSPQLTLCSSLLKSPAPFKCVWSCKA
jgi:hypothetical protein